MSKSFRIQGLSAALDAEKYRLDHILFKQNLTLYDLAKLECLRVGDRTLVSLANTGKTLMVDRVK